MDSFAKKQNIKGHNTKKYTTKNVDKNLFDIELEYGLKINNFNPKNVSPNVFCNRLAQRMKTYYYNLYNSNGFV